MRKTFFALACLVWLLPSGAHADLCGDIADGADGWAVLADTVDEIAEEGGPTREEAAELDKAIGELCDATEELAEVLVDEGNADEEHMGGRLLRSIRDLKRAETFEEIVDAMDDITDDLDDIVDYCDEQ